MKTYDVYQQEMWDHPPPTHVYFHRVCVVTARTAEHALRLAKQKNIWAPVVQEQEFRRY
ncbi:MAG: hypothetical protein ABL993_00975 [Vicinamibacterales bacterium]